MKKRVKSLIENVERKALLFFETIGVFGPNIFHRFRCLLGLLILNIVTCVYVFVLNQ